MNDEVEDLRRQLGERTRELAASEERFKNLITRNADAIVLVDRDGVVRFVNPAGELLFHRSAGELVGTMFGFPALAGERTELDLVDARGAPAVVEMRVVETEWEGERALLAVLRDITDQKRAEQEREELIRAQAARTQAEEALRERDEFLAIASHELKTPVSTLSATSQLLMRRLRRQGALQPDQLRSALSRVDEQSRRVARMVGQLLDVSRINAGKLALELEDVDLEALLRQLTANLPRSTSDHHVALRVEHGLRLRADPLRLEQVFSNLLENAVKYTPKGGHIQTEAVAVGGAHVRVSVRDHGLGVPPERRQFLFDRFDQAHSEGHRSGMGLGLFICREIVELHGGRIHAEFPDDGGSCFVVTLPKVPPEVDGR